MFEKFTEKAKRILFLARYEASQQGAKQIGTEHILLGLLKDGEETTRELFTRANVSMDLLEAELERRVRFARNFRRRSRSPSPKKRSGCCSSPRRRPSA